MTRLYTRSVSFMKPTLLLFLLMGTAMINLTAQTCITEPLNVDPDVIEVQCEGESLTLTVFYTGGATLPTVLWEFDDGSGFVAALGLPNTTEDLNPGGTEASLTISSLAHADHTGFYRATFSGSCTDVSGLFDVSVNGDIDIGTQPTSGAVCETVANPSVSFTSAYTSVNGQGTPRNRWQWSATGTSPWRGIKNSSDGNDPNITVDVNTLDFDDVNVFPSTPGTVYLRNRVLLDGCASQFSDVVTLTLDEAPTVTAPTDMTICSGDEPTIEADGTASTYTWTSDILGDSFDPADMLTTVFTDDGTPGDHTLTIETNAVGACAAASDDVVVTVNTLSIDTHTPDPTEATVCDGADQDFTVDYTNSETATVVWEVSTVAVPAFTPVTTDTDSDQSSTLSLLNIDGTMLDGAVYKATITAGECVVESEEFELTVNGPASITTPTTPNATICYSDESALFTTTSVNDGSGDIEYQWQVDSDGVPGSATLTTGYALDSTNYELMNAVFPVSGSIFVRVRARVVGCPQLPWSAFTELIIDGTLPPTVDAGADVTICSDGSHPLTAAMVDDPQDNFDNIGSWTSDNGGTFSDENDVNTTFTPAGAGTYTLTLTSYDAPGVCEVVTDMITVTVDELPTVTVSAGAMDVCQPNSVELTVVLTPASTTGSWAVTVGSGAVSTTPAGTHYIPDPTDDLVTLTYTADVTAGCTVAVSDDVSINFDNLILGNNTPADQTLELCEGESGSYFRHILDGASSAATASWYYYQAGETTADGVDATTIPGAGTQGTGGWRINFADVSTDLNTDTFYVVFETAVGACRDTVSGFTMTVDTLPVISGIEDLNVCAADESIALTPMISMSQAATGSWTSPATGFNGDTYTWSAADVSAGSVDLTYTVVDPSGTCGDVDFTITLTFDNVTFSGYTPAGPNFTRFSCTDNNLIRFKVNYETAGIITGATTVAWSYSDDGVTYLDASTNPDFTIFTNDAAVPPLTRLDVVPANALLYDDYNFIATVTADACTTTSDTFTLQSFEGGTIDAGADATYCNLGDTVFLDATVTGGYIGESVQWSIVEPAAGAGVIENSTDLTGAYYLLDQLPVGFDPTTDTLRIEITTGNPPGNCGAISDMVKFTIPAANGIEAGPDDETCDITYTLAGAVASPVTTGTWSTSGTGSFSDPLSPTAVYSVSADDATAGSVILTFTSNIAVGDCPAAYDEMILTIGGTSQVAMDPTSPASVGPICESVTVSPEFTAAGTITGTGVGPITYQWQYSDDAGTTWNDIIGETAATLTLDEDGNADLGIFPDLGESIMVRNGATLGFCSPEYSTPATLDVSPDAEAVVDAGADDMVSCEDLTYTLSGALGSNATSATWSLPGGSTVGISDVNDLNATYTFTQADKVAGDVSLVLTSNNPAGVCDSGTDTVVVSFINTITVDATEDQIFCDNLFETINYQFTPTASDGGNVSAVLFYSGGAGPSISGPDANGTYTFNKFTPALDSFVIVVSSLVEGPDYCPVATDTLTLVYQNDISASPFPFETTCFENGAPYTLNNAFIFDATITSSTWSLEAGPAGTFDDVFDLDTDFNPSVPGIYTLRLSANSDTSTDCPVVSDEFNLIVDSITVTDQNPAVMEICSGESVNLFVNATKIDTNSQTISYERQFSTDSSTWNMVMNGPAVADPSDNTLQSISQTISPIESGYYRYVLETANGCVTITDPVLILVPEAPVSFTSNDISLANQCTDLEDASFTTTYTLSTNTNNVDFVETDTVLWFYSDISATGPYTAVPSTVVGYNATTLDLTNADGAVWPDGGETIWYRLSVFTSINDSDYCEEESSTAYFIEMTQNTPIANAGMDQSICYGDPVSLAGMISGTGTSGIWSTSGTQGVAGFNNPNALNATYTPDAADSTAGTVTLTLTTNDPGGVCPPDVDELVVTISSFQIDSYNPSNATLTDNACEGDNANFRVNYMTSDEALTTIEWEYNDGTGYQAATAFDILDNGAGQARLRVNDVTIAQDGYTFRAKFTVGACTEVISDEFTLDVFEDGTVGIEPVADVCESGATIDLDGTLTGGYVGLGVTWSTSGSGSFMPDAFTEDAQYVVDPADEAAGSIMLTLTTDNPAGPCEGKDSTITINFPALGQITAGSDITTCETMIPMAGVFGAPITSATWSSTGTGTFADVLDPNTIYTASAADIASGSVTITLSSNNVVGSCPTVFDEMILTLGGTTPFTFSLDPTDVGPICETETDATFMTMVTGSPGDATYQWEYSTDAGTTWIEIAGADDTDLTLTDAETYWPGLGGSILVRNGVSQGACMPAYSAEAELSIDSEAALTVIAGTDITLDCTDTQTPMLEGMVSGGVATTGTWSHNGTGSFVDPNNLTTMYQLSTADQALPEITLTLTTNDPGSVCGAQSDDVVVTIDNVGTIEAGDDIAVCDASPTADLAGTLNTLGDVEWTIRATNGGAGGTFSDITDLNATYTFGASTSDTLVLTRLVGTNSCASISDEVVVSRNAALNAGADIFTCYDNGADIQLTGTQDASVSSITWTIEDGPAGTFNDPNFLTPLFTPSEPGIYTLALTGNNDLGGACPIVSDEIVVLVDSIFVIDQTGPTIEVCEGGTGEITADIEFFGESVTVNLQFFDGVQYVTSIFNNGTTYTQSPATVSDDFPANNFNVAEFYRFEIITAENCVRYTESTQMLIPENATNFSATGDLSYTNQCSDLENVSFSTQYSVASSAPITIDTALWYYSVDGENGTYIPVPSTVSGYNTNTIDIMSSDVIWPLVGENIWLQLRAYTTVDGGIYCEYISDQTTWRQLQISEQSPIATAGIDAEICYDESVTLTGMINAEASSGTWTVSSLTPDAGGAFDDANFLGATYTPGAVATNGGVVDLVLTANAGNSTFCDADTDTLTVDVYRTDITGTNNLNPTACAGQTRTFNVMYTTSHQAATTIVWEYAAPGGTFAPVAGSAIDGDFIVLDIDGQARLRGLDISTDYDGYTFRANITTGTCATIVSSVFTLGVNVGPIAIAGDDQSICFDADVNLVGNIGGTATSATWSVVDGNPGGSTVGIDDASMLSTTYEIQTPDDLTAGNVILVLTTDDPGGPCPADTDTLIVDIDVLTIDTYSPASLVRTDCSEDPEFLIVNYTVGVGNSASVVTWTYSETMNGTYGALPAGVVASGDNVSNVTARNARLDMASLDVSMAGFYTATIENGACSMTTDTFEVVVNGLASITDEPMDILDVCQSEPMVTFTAVAANAGSGTLLFQWQVSATGTNGWSNVPGAITETLVVDNADFPPPGDSNFYRLRVRLTSCTQIFTDVVELGISLDQNNEVDANSDEFVCQNSDFIMQGSIVTGTSATWSIFSGGGSIAVPSATTGAIYTPDTDYLGDVELVLTSNDPGNVCPAATDTVILTYEEPLTVTTDDINICVDADFDSLIPIDLTAVVVGDSLGGGSWTTTGLGTIDMDDMADATYTLDATEGGANTSVELTYTADSRSCVSEASILTIFFNQEIIVTDSLRGEPFCVGESFFARTDFIDNAGVVPTWFVKTTDGTETELVDDNVTVNIVTGNDGSNAAETYTRLEIINATTALNGNKYFVVLNNNDCEATGDTFNIMINDIVFDGYDDVSICSSETTSDFGGTVMYNGVDSDASSLRWSYSTDGGTSFTNVPNTVTGYDGEVLTLTDADASVWPAVGGSVQLRLRVNGIEGCTANSQRYSDTILFSRETDAELNLSDGLVDRMDEACNDAPYTLPAPVFVVATSVVTYVDLIDGALTAGGGIFDVTDPAAVTYTNATPGTYLLIGTTNIPNGNCDAVSDTLWLTIREAITITPIADFEVCIDGDLSIAPIIVGDLTDATYSWSVNNGGSFASANQDNATLIPSGAGDYEIDFSITSAGASCLNTSITFTMTVGGGIAMNSVVSPTIDVCAGDGAILNVTHADLVAQVVTWEVSTDNGGTWDTLLVDGTPFGIEAYSVVNTLSSAMLDITELSSDANGLMVRVQIEDQGCEEASEVFTLNVYGTATYSTQPTDIVLCEDDTEAAFNALATNSGQGPSGTGTIGYRWEYSTDGGSNFVNVPTVIAGWNSPNLLLFDTDAIWPTVGNSIVLRSRASVGNGCALVYSDPTTLTNDGGPCGATDLITQIQVLNSIVIDTENIGVVVDLVNIGTVTSAGTVTVRLNKDIRFNPTWDAGLTSLGLETFDNSIWTFDDSSLLYYEFTTNLPLNGGNNLSLGLQGTFSANGNNGTSTFTSSISTAFSGGDSNVFNNSDAEQVVFSIN